MTTYTTTVTTLPVTEPVASAASTTRNLGRWSALALICGILCCGAFLAFPQYDDGWMTLMLREQGAHSLSVYMTDRPIFGLLLEFLARFGAANKLIFVAVNAILWIVFALEAAMLFRKIFPELRSFAILASCLTLAPIVVQTQLCTLLVVVPANLATILGYAAILLLLESDRAEGKTVSLPFGGAIFLAICAVAISEYGVATNLIGCALLFGLGLTSFDIEERHRRMIRAGWLLALNGCAYVIFTKTAKFTGRPDVAPSYALHRGLSKWLEIPFDVVSGTWHSIIGSYASAYGTVNLAWDSKSTMLGVLIGLSVGTLLCLGVQEPKSSPWNHNVRPLFASRLAVLLFATIMGLLPFSIMGRATTLGDFGSRFRIPIMPLAAAATLCITLTLVRPHFRWIAVMALGFIAGYSSWISTYSAVERKRAISALEGVLEPYVRDTGGIAVAVVPFERFEAELTADISATWPVEEEKKLWVIPADAASKQFGNRERCRLPDELDVRARGLSRVGKLDRALWIDAPEGRPPQIESYCETPQ